MAQGASGRARRPPFLKMVEKMNLIVLGRTQDRRSDQNGRDIQYDAGKAHQEKSTQDREQ